MQNKSASSVLDKLREGKSPSEKWSMPVIGVIETKPLEVEQTNMETGEKKKITFPPDKYEVIAEEETFYVCNQWYDEGKGKPQLVSKSMVKKFKKV